MAIPSSTPIVLNSNGTPPASRTHCFTYSPTLFRWTWPGTISTKELHTATNGFPMSASVTPVAFSRLRCGARSTPFLMTSDRIVLPPVGRWSWFKPSGYRGFEHVELRKRRPDLLHPGGCGAGLADQPLDRAQLPFEEPRGFPGEQVDDRPHGVRPLARHPGEVLLRLPRDPPQEVAAHQWPEQDHGDEEPEQLEVGVERRGEPDVRVGRLLDPRLETGAGEPDPERPFDLPRQAVLERAHGPFDAPLRPEEEAGQVPLPVQRDGPHLLHHRGREPRLEIPGHPGEVPLPARHRAEEGIGEPHRHFPVVGVEPVVRGGAHVGLQAVAEEPDLPRDRPDVAPLPRQHRDEIRPRGFGGRGGALREE